jgi:hypothetical protein
MDVEVLKIHFSNRGKDGWLAASVSSPRFCVSADTLDEVREKARRAFLFWAANRDVQVDESKFERNVTPFAPQRVEELPLEACA